MADFAGKMLTDAIGRLATKYGFDKNEAQDFLMSGGIHVKLPPIEKSKLPWCGVVDEGCCRAIQKNGGLFTQCTNSPLDGGWCKKCAKDVEKNGTPTNGDVEARLAKDIMEYKVGNVEVKPYILYMEKNGITQEKVLESAAEYGLTIDPRQFEKKKRGRRNTTPRNMEAPATPLPAQAAEPAEPAQELAAEPVNLGALHQERLARENDAKEAKAKAKAEKEANEAEPQEGAVFDDKLTIAQINSMRKEDLHIACEKHGIDITGKNQLELKKILKTKVV